MFYIKMSHLAENSELHIIPNFEKPNTCMKKGDNWNICMWEKSRFKKNHLRQKRWFLKHSVQIEGW